MVQKTQLGRHKSRGGLKSEGLAILSYFKPGRFIPSGKVERQLRKLEGIKEVTIPPLSHMVKIRYDPSVVTVEKMRSIVQKLGSRREH